MESAIVYASQDVAAYCSYNFVYPGFALVYFILKKADSTCMIPDLSIHISGIKFISC